MNLPNKKFIFKTLLVVLLSVTSINAWAESNDKYDTVYDNCLSKAGRINNQIVNDCSSVVSNMVKKDMNRIYDIIYKYISEQSKDDAKKFEQSQRAWLKYRESHCELMGRYVGTPMYSFCPMGLNRARVSELSELAGEY